MRRSILGYRLLAMLSPDPAPAGDPPPAPAAPDPAPVPGPNDPPPDPAAPDPDAPPAEPPAPAVVDTLFDAMMENLLPKTEPPIEPAPEPTAAPVPDPNAPPTPTEPTPGTPPAPPAAPDPAAPTPPATPAAKKKVRSLGKEHPLVTAQPPPPSAPAPSASPAPPQDFSLTEEQREEMEEAMVAERLFPDRYKGHPQRLKAWYEKTVGVDLAENQQLAESKPVVQQTDYKKVARTIVAEAAERRVEQAMQPKLDRIEMDARKAQLMPEVEKFANNDFPQQIARLIQADENSPMLAPLKVAMERGGDAAQEEYPLEFQVMRDATIQQQSIVKTFLLMKNGAEAYNEKNPQHRAVADFINNEGSQFSAKGGAYRIQDGRQFLPRSEMFALLTRDPAERDSWNPATCKSAKYWTFTDAAIVDMIAIRTKQFAENQIKNIADQAKRFGFAPAPKKAVAKTQTPPAAPAKEVRPPAARASAAPAPTGKPPTPAFNDTSGLPISLITGDLVPHR